jgi:hypothetical protein
MVFRSKKRYQRVFYARDDTTKMNADSTGIVFSRVELTFGKAAHRYLVMFFFNATACPVLCLQMILDIFCVKY